MNFSEESRSGTADFVAFALACVAGFLLRPYFPSGQWSTYGPLLVAYHLFLAWLLATAEHKVGISFPIIPAVLTHVACMACVIAVVGARHYIPFYRYVGMSITGLAFFEHRWLFEKNKHGKDRSPVAPSVPVLTATAEDYEEWLRMRSRQKNPEIYVGGSPRSDFEAWIKLRAKRRELVAMAQDSAAGTR